MDLIDYLRTAKDDVTYLDAFKEVHVVLGNPACDLDSVVSSIIYSCYLSKISNEESRTIIPVLNIPREDFLLRTEVVSFLSSQEVNETFLIFRDDIDLSTLAAGSRLKLTLVDHNILSREDADQLDPCIVQIIDHHDNGRVEEEGREIDIQLEPVGSCTTLVLEDILNKSEELLDERIASLALGTILLDTVNLSTTAGRTTDKDIGVVDTLSRHCPNLVHQEVFDALQKSKFDVTGLSAMDVLRKDLKSVSVQDTTIGLSSIPCSIEVLLDKSEGNQVLQEFCESQRLSVLLLMAAFQGDDGNLKRELGVFSLSQEDELRAKLTSHLTSDAAGLQLEEQSVDCKDLSSFHHGNVAASRKLVLPLVQKFLEEVGVTNQSTTGDEQKPEDRRADGESSVETEDGGSEMKVVDTADLLGSFDLEPSSQTNYAGVAPILHGNTNNSNSFNRDASSITPQHDMHIHNITTAQNMQQVYNLLDLDPMSPPASDKQQPISQTSSSLNDLLGFDPFSSLNTDLQGEEQKEIFQSEGSVSSPMDQPSDAISDSLLLVDFGASEDPLIQSTDTEDIFSVWSSQGQTGFEIESGSTDGNVRLSETREGFDSFLLEPTEIGDQLIKRLDPSIHGNKDDHRQESFNVTDSDGSSLADLKKDDFQDEKEDKTVEEISGIQRDEEDKIEMPETMEILVSEKDSSDLLSTGSEEEISVEKGVSEREAGTLDELELNGELAEEKRGKFSSTIAPNNSFGDLDEYARTSTPQLDDDEVSEKVEELHRSRSESLIANESQNEGDKITIKNLEMIATLDASGNEVQGEDAGEQTTISELKSFLGVLNGEEHFHGDDNSQSDDKGNDVGDDGLTWGTVEEDGAHTEEDEGDDASGQSSDAPLLSEGALSNDRESEEHIEVHERPTQSEIGIEIEAGKSDSDLEYSSDNADSSDHCQSVGNKDTRQGSFEETSQQNSSFAMFTSKVGTSEKFDVQESDNGNGASDCGGTINDDKSLSSDQNEMDMMDEKNIDDETNEDDSMTISVDLQVNSLQEVHSENQHHIAEKMQFGQTEKEEIDHFFTPESDELSHDNQNLRDSEDQLANDIIEDVSMNKFTPDYTEDDERSSQEEVDEEGIDGGLVRNALSNPSIIEVGLTSGSDVSSRGEQDNIGDFSSMMTNEHDENEISVSIFGDTSLKSSLPEVDTQNVDENVSRGQTKENIQTNPFANEVDELFNVNENLTTEQDGKQEVPFEHESSSEMIHGTTNDQKFNISVESTSELHLFEEPKHDTHKNMYERGSQVQLESNLQTNPFSVGVGELSNGKRSFRVEEKDSLGDEIYDISTGGTSDVIPILQHELKVHETNDESQPMGNPQTNPFVGEMKLHSDRNPFMETDKEDISDQDFSSQMMQTSDGYAMVESSVDTCSFASPPLLLIKGDEHQDQEKFIEGPADQHRQTNPFDVEMGGLFDEKLISNSDQDIWDPEKSVMQGIGGSSFVSYSQEEEDTGDHSHTEEEQITALYEGNLESNPFTSGSGLFHDPSSKMDENTNRIESGADELVASKEISNHEKSLDWKPPVPSDGNQLDGQRSKRATIEVFETGFSSEEEVATTKENESLEMVDYDKDDEVDTEVSPETEETGEMVLNGNPNTPFVFDMSHQQVEEKGLVDIMAVEETENHFRSDDMDKPQENKLDSEKEKNRGSITVSEEGLATEVASSDRDSNPEERFDFLPDVDILPSKSADDTVIEDQQIVEENENLVCSTRQEEESQREIDHDDMNDDGNDALLELSVTSKKEDQEMAEHQVEIENEDEEDVVKEQAVESLEVHPTVHSAKDLESHKDQESHEMDGSEEDSVEEDEKPRELHYNDMGFNDSSQFTLSDGNEALLELSVTSKKEEQELSGHQEMEDEDEDVIKEQAVESLEAHLTVHSSKDLESHKDQESHEMDGSEEDSVEEEEKPREVDYNDMGFNDSSQFTINDGNDDLLELSVTSNKEDQEMTEHQEMEDVVKEEAVEPLEVHPTVYSSKDLESHEDEESHKMDRSEDGEEEEPREVDYNDMGFNDSSQFTINDGNDDLLELSVTSNKEDQEMTEHQEMEDVVKEEAVEPLEVHPTVYSSKDLESHEDQESHKMDRSEDGEEEEPREVDYNDMGFNDSSQFTINDGNDDLLELSVTSKKEDQEMTEHQEMEDVVKEEAVEPLEVHPTVYSSKDLESHEDQESHEMDRSEEDSAEEEEEPREVDYNDMGFNDSSQFTIKDGNEALLELSVTSKKEDQEMTGHQEMEDEGDEDVVKEEAVEPLEANPTVHSSKDLEYHKDQESQEMDRSEEDSAEEEEEPREVDYNDMGFNDSFQFTIKDGNDALLELSVTSKKEDQELAGHQEMEDEDEDVIKEQAVESLEVHPTVHSSKDLESHKDQESQEMHRSEDEEEEKPREVDYNDMGFNDSSQFTINDGNDALFELSVTSKKEDQEMAEHQEMEGDEDVIKEQAVESLQVHPTVHSSKDLEYHKDQESQEMDGSEEDSAEEEEEPREVDYNDMGFNDSSQFTIHDGNDALLELSVTSKKEDQELAGHQEMEDEDEEDVIKEQAVESLEAHLTVHSSKDLESHKDQESHEMDGSEEDSVEEEEKPKEVDYNDMGFNDSSQFTVNDGNDDLLELSVTSKKEDQEMTEHQEMEDEDEDVIKEQAVESLEAHLTVLSSTDWESHKDQESQEMDRSEDEEEEKPREVDHNDMGFNDSSQLNVNDGNEALLELSVTSKKEVQEMSEHQVEKESLNVQLTVDPSMSMTNHEEQEFLENNRDEEVSLKPEEENPREVDHNEMDYANSSQFTMNDDGNDALLELSVTSKKEDQEITGHQVDKEDEHLEEEIKKQTIERLEVHPTADLSKDVENHQEQESFEIDGDEEGSIEKEENPREVDHNEMDFKHEYQFVVNDEERNVLKLTDDLNLQTVEHQESQLDEVAVFVEGSLASDERIMDTMEESKEVDAGGEHGVIKLDDEDFKVSTGERTTEYEDEVHKMSIETEDYCIIREIIDGIISQIVDDKMENDLVTRERITENALFKREAEEEQENVITSTHNEYPEEEEITRKVEEMNPESSPTGMKQDEVSLSYKKPVQISSNFIDLEAKQFELSLKPPGSIDDEEVTSPVLSDLSESGVDMSPNHQSSSPKVRPSSLSLSDLSINSNKGGSVALPHMDTPTVLSPSLDSLSSYSHEGYFASPDFEDDTPTPGMSDVKSLGGMEFGEPAYKRALSVDSELNRNVNRGWSDNQSLLDAILLTQKSREELTEETPQAEADISVDANQHGAEGKTTDESREAERGEAEGAEEDDMDNISIKITRKDPPSITPEVQALVDEADGGRGRLDTLLSDTSIGDFDYGDDDDDDDDEDESDREAKGAYSGAADSPNRKRLSAELALNLEDGTSITTEIIDAAYPAVLTPSSTEMSWDDDNSMDKKSSKPEKIAEYTAREEHEDRWRWRTVKIGDTEHMVDNKVIEPFKKVLSHGGYYGNTMNAVIVIASCYLPEKSRKDYEYVMHNLFLYVVSSLELLVAQDYMIVYFHGAAPRTKIPSLAWMKRCYQMIDRRLKKNLKGLYIVHPTGWLKTVITFTRPFISAKFYRKLKFIYKLSDLEKVISMEYIYIPEEVKRFDDTKQEKAVRPPSDWIDIKPAEISSISSSFSSPPFSAKPRRRRRNPYPEADQSFMPQDADDLSDVGTEGPDSGRSSRRMSFSGSLGFFEDDFLAYAESHQPCSIEEYLMQQRELFDQLRQEAEEEYDLESVFP